MGKMFKLDKKQNFKKRWYEKSGWIIFWLIVFFSFRFVFNVEMLQVE